ncbi:site-2 protease family protein [Actinomycetospora lutea]|uniref:site-2 protease family protein n=1 Tax=Actinomycetospora lutea TaxID=663604 RepID=UPI0023650079|nr:site-2 protease family protein [Actinomycetospora lutea]MDD7939552.1 site-2 protease family protein [Actinomycetospora lutea]
MGATRTDAGAVRLGRIAGFPVAAHWSVLGIVALVAVLVARSGMPLLAPGHGALAYGVAGLAVALLLMVSLLAHEVAHALVARAHGLAVESITLWLLGGTTRLRGEPDRPAAELRIAVVGPLVSGLLAGLFAVVAVVAARLSADLVVAVGIELALVNLVLAVFNLLPAAPLDGGRVLRAVLWARGGDRWGAGVTAARAGRGLGAVLVGGGLVLGMTVGFDGLWLALVGWFIGLAAGAEERRARQARALAGVPVSAAATTVPPVVPDGATPQELAAAVADPAARAAGVLLVDGDGRPSGYVPPERLRIAPARRGEPAGVRRLAVPPSRLTVVGPDDALSPLLTRLAEPGSRLVVLSAGAPTRLVAADDVERLLRARGPGTDRGTPPTATAVPAADAPPPPGWWWHGGPAPVPAPPPRPRSDRGA